MAASGEGAASTSAAQPASGSGPATAPASAAAFGYSPSGPASAAASRPAFGYSPSGPASAAAPATTKGALLYPGCGRDALPLLLLRHAHDELIFFDIAPAPRLLRGILRTLRAHGVTYRRLPDRDFGGGFRAFVFRLGPGDSAPRLVLLPSTPDHAILRPPLSNLLLPAVISLWVSGFVPWAPEEEEGEASTASPEEQGEASTASLEEDRGAAPGRTLPSAATTSGPPAPEVASLLPRLRTLYVQDSPRVLRPLLPLLPPSLRIVRLPPVSFAPHTLFDDENPFGDSFIICHGEGSSSSGGIVYARFDLKSHPAAGGVDQISKGKASTHVA